VTDENSKYIGAIGMGFNIATLRKSIEQTLVDYNNLSYIILNNKLDIYPINLKIPVLQ
jgi:hypothetical protein